jgi:hypothetical protein
MTNDDFRRVIGSASEVQFTFTGRKSGKKFSIPIWFVMDADKLFLLPMRGSRSEWYKGLLKNPVVELEVSGKKVGARALPLRDKEEVEVVLEKFRAKYGASDVKKYYAGQDAAVEVEI